jgi:hypothetical protein
MEWPDLPYAEWKDTRDTLQLWTQIVGKVRLACTPWINHSWHVTLYVTARGLTTSLIPHDTSGFQIDFDFVDHHLDISRQDGRRARIGLYARSVADFHEEFFAKLGELDIDVRIHGSPNEIPDAIPFAADHEHAAYDRDYANRFWIVLAKSARVLTDFRGDFRGKCSPVHFFWGGFDLAVTRFSGRPAPVHPGGVPNLPDFVTREAYSHEASSAGFWPGGEMYPHAMFYAYAYPVPEGLDTKVIAPPEARWEAALGEFVLPYDAVRESAAPDSMLQTFLHSSYEAIADVAGWDRRALGWGEGGRPAKPTRRG